MNNTRAIERLLALTFLLGGGVGILAAGPDSLPAAPRPAPVVTNAAQFRTLSGADYLVGCNFRLTGVVTLVDPNRDLLVLQDATGAVALHLRLADHSFQVGQQVTLVGANGVPYFAGFPDFPHRPAERNILSSSESPMNSSEYRLTRLRGVVRPPVTGEYHFWVTSDNSSELWLSLNADPARARKIASVPRFGWAAEHEWTRFPAQRSDAIQLRAGEAYYLEAVGEQTTVGEHLAVAWQGPGLEQAIIGSAALTPWGAPSGATNGLLRECWTNYTAGDLEGVAGPREFESIITAEKVQVLSTTPGALPKPERLALNQRLLPEDNYRWVQAEGMVTFTGADGAVTWFELSDGQARVQVRTLRWPPQLGNRPGKVPVRVEGVCEGIFDQRGMLAPGLIWAVAEDSITYIETVATNAETAASAPLALPLPAAIPAMQGFYNTRGVLTFNDWVFGTNYLFVQEDAAAMQVVLAGGSFDNRWQVGQWVDLGGSLMPGVNFPVITPLVVKGLGWHALPPPIVQPLGFPIPGNREGRWSELEAVGHSVNSNGTLSVVGKDGMAYLWIGQTASNTLSRYVDAKLRARGVLMLTLLDAPLLLVPSRQFIDVEKPAPEDPFATPRSSIASLVNAGLDAAWPHRVRVFGEVTYRDGQSFYLQDATGGIRVWPADPAAAEIGQTIEVLAFPAPSGFGSTLIKAQFRPAVVSARVGAKDLDLSEALSAKQHGSLVQVSATLLAQKANATGQVLELQEQQRVFTATLAAGQGALPDLPPGSRLDVRGVCDNETVAAPSVGEKSPRVQLRPSLNLLLRSPADVRILRGPPWWTWRRTAALVGGLLLVLIVTLLWVQLLRRRLERQQAARLVFSRQVLKRVEDDRRRIAANLHDGLGQVLLLIKHHALLAMQRSPDEQHVQQRLDEISAVTSQAIEEVRQITHGLRPYQLDRLGLTQAIRTSVSQAAGNSPMVFAIRVEDVDGLFDEDAEIHIYRIVQEAVTNVGKHSAATEAAVVIKRRPGVVSLSIRDNGRGFDPARAAADPERGYGLSGMAERARILGAALVIDSRPGGGTSLTVEVPAPVRNYDANRNSVDRG